MLLFRKNAVQAAALCLLVSSCNLDKNSIRVTSTNFTDEIELQQNLVFTFDRDLVTDSVIDRWDSTAYLTFTPAVKGLYKWNSSRELVFSPSSSFQPGTGYQVAFTGMLLKNTNRNFSLDEMEGFSFHTPYLKLTGTDASWARSSQSPEHIGLNMTLRFNYKVDPAEAGRLTRFFLNGKSFPFDIKSTAPSNEITLHADGLPRDFSKQAVFEIKIEKGLHCLESQYKTTDQLVLSQSFPAPEKLDITQVQGLFEGTSAFLEVNTNQPVEDAGISSHIKIKPAVPFTIEHRESGFIISGNFTAGASYEVTISKKLKGMLGGEMASDFISLVPFGQLAPSLSFVSSKGLYLSSKGSKTIGISIVNIPKVKLTVTRIYENNIQAYMRSNRYNDYGDDGEYGGYAYNDYNLWQLGDVVMEQDYETKNLGRSNGVSLLNLDFSQQGQFRGIYLVRVVSADDQWRKAVKLVSVSDIGLIAKETEDDIYVFANSILNMDPVAGVKVNFTSSNNQVLYTGTTDKDGVAVFSGIRSKFPGFKVSMITARSGNDFNFMIFNDSRVETSRFEVGGARTNESGYQAFIYGDREIYRPGETIHNNTIIRNNMREVVADLPVKIKYLLPNGKELQSFRKSLSRQGACESTVEIAAGAITGTYTLEVYTSNDILIGSKSFSVEEFIPDRINVVLKTESESYSLDDSIHADFTAVNLFGPPAADRNYEATFSFSKKYFYAKDFPNYNFNIKGSEKLTFPNVLRQGKTDAAGKGNEAFSMDESYAGEGMLEGRVFVTVFDESGRPVNRVKHFDIRTQDVFFGIRIPDYYVSTLQPIQLGFAATNEAGKGVDRATGRMQVIRVKWHTIMERTYDTHYRYVSQREEEILVDKTIKISKSGTTVPFTPNESGEYLVRLMQPGSEKFVESQFYAWRWGSNSNTSFEVNNEGQVDITLDKEKYTPGEKASVLFKTPFSGKLLVTIERNKVMEHHYLNTDRKAAMLTIPITDDFIPNVYISATLFKPLDDGSLPLTVAHGFSSIAVEKSANRLPVTIMAVEKSKSATRQQITVKTIAKSNIEMTIAVVDEGIMQLKNTPSPDPYGYFYQKQALEVSSYDVYPYLLPDLKMKRSSAAGDGYDLQKRVNPLSNKRVKLVAFWSGVLKTNGAGEATCSVDIPQFSGDLRIMAVAYKDQAFGHAEKHMKVADPVVISTALPRFLSPGDTLLMPVTVTNTLARTVAAGATISVTGPIEIVGASTQQISIAAGSESRVSWKLFARKEVGEGSVQITVNGDGSAYTDKTEITIRPPASLQKKSDAGNIAGGTVQTLNLAADFIPSGMKTRLLLSRSPLAEFTDDMEYLLDYPYGCVEQTTSTAFPQLYYADLVKSIKNKPGHTVNISRNIQAAISRLQSMQLYNGSLSYWPGGEEESWWGSIYACHFLIEAKKAGYEVNQATIDKILSYLQVKAKSKTETTYYYYDANDKRQARTFAAKDIFYSLYVLAISGRSDLATMNYYKYKPASLALDSRYLLATTFLVCGDRKSYTDLLPSAFEGEQSVKETGGSFSSFVRDQALALSGLLEADPDNPQVGVMVSHLSAQLRKERYLSTQERAFAFLALGKFMNRNRDNDVTATVSADGTVIAEFKGEDVVLNNNIGNKKITVATKGKGTLYYSWETAGLTKDGSFTQEDNFLRIRKTFFNRFGQPVKANDFRQNDLVVVKLTLENLERSNISNIVITDMLPAGFEIENPRIGAVAELSWVKDQSYSEYMDVRDDRINLFTSADHTVKNFYYLVRAVSTGKFVMGPVSADAMYNGAYHSYHGAGTIRVTAK